MGTRNGKTAELRRADALRNDERIFEAAKRLLEQSPAATLSDIAAAAGVSRSSLYRRFADRAQLIAELDARPEGGSFSRVKDPLPTGRLGRQRALALDAIHVFDVVPPSLLPEQLVAEAQRIAQVPVALYVLDIDGTHLLYIAGSRRLGERLPAPSAIGPELDADGIVALRESLGRGGDNQLFPLWLRGRAIGVFIAFGRPREPLTEMARQAAAAVTLSERYTDVFARAHRRKQPKAAAEIQQSLLPPRIVRIAGAEVAGNVLPTYEVAGDWFDVVENVDAVWLTLADGLGDSTRSAASGAVALGALRASRRSGASIGEALLVMHQTLREMPGPRSEMAAIVSRWEPGSGLVELANCGHVAPLILREGGEVERLWFAPSHGLGSRSTPKPSEVRAWLRVGDRLVLTSDGVTGRGEGQAGLGEQGLIEAALRARRASAADAVREVLDAVRASAAAELTDDATVVCLAIG